MLKEQRFQIIRDALSAAPTVTLPNLAAACGVSQMTVRRDLAAMEGRGVLRRVRGGAAKAEAQDPGYCHRAQESVGAKQAIGAAAASIIHDGQTVFIDAGSTAAAVARALAHRAAEERLKINIATHAVNVSAELAGFPGITLYQLGGEIDGTTMAATGDTLPGQVAEMNFDIFFMGVTGVDLTAGCTNSSSLGIALKRAVSDRARGTWIIGDAVKWGVISAYRVIPIERAVGWITDATLSADEARLLDDRGVELRSVATSALKG